MAFTSKEKDNVFIFSRPMSWAVLVSFLLCVAREPQRGFETKSLLKLTAVSAASRRGMTAVGV